MARQLKHALFGLLLLGIVAVHGSSQIRFANTQLKTYSYLGLAAQPNGPINGTLTTNMASGDALPLSPYQSLPQPGLPFNQLVTFYVHDVVTNTDRAFVNATLADNQSYTFVAAGSDVPLKLFSVEERPSNASLLAGKAALKIINVVDSSSYSSFSIEIFDGTSFAYANVAFGTSSNFLVYDVSSVLVWGEFDYLNSYSQVNVTLQRDATTFLYLRGTNGSDLTWSTYVVPFTLVVNPPVNSPVAPVTPTSAPQTARIRLINGAFFPDIRVPAVMHTMNYQYVITNSTATSSLFSYDNIFGEYLTVPSNVPITFVVDGFNVYTTLVLPSNSQSSLVFYNSINGTYHLLYLDEAPARATYPENPEFSKYRVVNTRQGDTLTVYVDGGWYFGTQVTFGSYFDVVAGNISDISSSEYWGSSSLPRGQPDTLTTYYVLGRVGSWDTFYWIEDETELPPPTSQGPVCANGYVETTGYCNCYSGFANDYNYPNVKCSMSPPYWCPSANTTSSSTDTGAVPSLYNLYVTRSNLGFSVYSAFFTGRRTLIEFPNPSCNLINNPSSYIKSVGGCADQFDVLIPFTTCGFTKTSNPNEDVYRAEMHVKHIESVWVNDNTIERVIDTPFTLLIRLPKNIAIESSVEVIAAPVYTVPLTAALVSQRVDTATQTAQLVYATSVPAQFIVESAQVQQRPYGVNATLHFSSTNCTSNYCLQYLVIDLKIGNCEISGYYSIDVSIGCRNQTNCPTDVQEAPVKATITSTIVAQRSCGDASVDVGLQGSLRAYNSLSFNTQSLSFGPGQPAYFLVNTNSPQVVISHVTLEQVYYQGPNIAGHFLLTNGGNISSRAAHNNFTWGQLSSSQLWFSFDVTVSKLASYEDTMFKLDNGQSGVYSFTAIVEVEWMLDGTPTANAPITLPSPLPSYNSTYPYQFKKRVALQGTLSQGSQLNAEVQITGTSSVQPDSTDKGTVSVGTNLAGLFSICIACVAFLVTLQI